MRFIYFLLITLIILIILSFKAHASPSILYFYDGDSVKIMDGSIEYKLRINHIDAPERNQAYGKKSRRALMQLCKDATIEVVITSTDQYQRQLGDLYCNQQDVSTYMISNGYAWFYKRYSKRKALAQVEENARKSKLGLWQDDQPIPPWVWRHLVNQQ